MIIIILSLCTTIFAGPPMKSDDPFVPALHEFEINIAIEAEDEDELLKRLPIVDINYGIYKNVQLTLMGSYIISDEEDDFDSFELAIKWLAYDGDIFSIAVYPKYKSYPIASIFNEGETYELAFPMNFSLSESFNLVLNIVYIYPKIGKEYFEYGGYLEYEHEKHSFFTELFLEEAQEKGEDSLMLGIVGYKYNFYQDISFMLSLGNEINNEKKTTIGYSGLQFIF